MSGGNERGQSANAVRRVKHGDGLSVLGLPGALTRTGWQPPENLSFADWTAAGLCLDKAEAGIRWWKGDWLRFGERKYGEMYAQAIEATGDSYQGLADCKWLAERFEFSRRRENLDWSLHREVAALELTDADALLDKAEQNGWSHRALRQAVKLFRRALREIAPDDLPTAGERWEIRRAGISELDIEPGSIDCIITDPPYPKEFLPVYSDLGALAARVLKSGGSCVVMVGQSYLPDILAALSLHLSYRWTLAYLTPGGQAAQLWDRTVNTFWKPILWFTKGEYSGDWLGDVCRSEPNDNDKRFHHWGQSESGMADIVRRFTRAGDLILDPFCGAGTTGVVAVAIDRRYIGSDIDAIAVTTARARLHAATSELRDAG